MQGVVQDRDGSIKLKTVYLGEGGVREEGWQVVCSSQWPGGWDAVAHMTLND